MSFASDDERSYRSRATAIGKSSRLHTAKILRLSMDLPLVIDIVDSDEKIQNFLPVLDPMMKGGLVTLEKVRVIDYRGEADQAAPDPSS